MQGIHFIDIECVPQAQYFPDGTPLAEFFKKRFSEECEKNGYDDAWKSKAGLYAEFGKIVSISIGMLTATKSNPQPMFFIKTITGRDEKIILQQFKEAITAATTLAGHNIMEFDAPYLMRRFIANGIPLPGILDSMTRKPWENPFLDTMKMWSGSAYNHKVSLDLLAHILGVPSPKQNMSGADVMGLYYPDDTDALIKDPEELERVMTNCLQMIAQYNAADVVCTARCFARLRGHKEIKDVDIFHVK